MNEELAAPPHPNGLAASSKYEVLGFFGKSGSATNK
jgi:hypothetical protein